ncbi:hypothetical protein ACF0H5_019750 [Mactra antiquata]
MPSRKIGEQRLYPSIMGWLLLVTTCLVLTVVNADYACVCSYNEEIDVFDKPDLTSNVIGQMYEFDCKPDAGMTAPQNWNPVMFQHQLGYIETNANINNQSCQGQIPDEDKLLGASTVAMTTMAGTTEAPTEPTTVQMMTSTMPQMTTTTTVMETSTSMPTPAPTNPITMAPMTTTTTQTTTVTVQTQTPSPTTMMPQVTTTGSATITGHIELCPQRLQQLAASRSSVVLAQYGDNCYEVVQNSVSWSHAEALCRQNGGHLAHIANEVEQNFIHTVLVKEHSHTVWIGLHDRASEENFEWTSGNTFNYSNWTPGRKNFYHNQEDCVFMKPNGEWDDIECGGDNPFQEIIQGHRHAYICQFATTNATPLDGDLAKCSNYLQDQSVKDGGILGQHGNNCYELLYGKFTWAHAESACNRRNGHLATINSAEEQAFVMEFMSRHSANHAVWIGLNDKGSEGNFHWISGEPMQYVNWVPNHQDNFQSHTREDCVLFIPYKNGGWDDVNCGTDNIFFGSSGEVHPYLCKFALDAHPGGIGGGSIIG